MRFSPLLVLFLLSFSLVAQSNQSTSHLEKIVLGSDAFGVPKRVMKLYQES